MKVIELNLLSVVPSRTDVANQLIYPGDAVLVERGRPRLLVIKCPCGCSEDYTINLDSQAGKAWRFYAKARSFTLFPSVWRDTGCESHYVIWDSKIYLFSKNNIQNNDWGSREIDLNEQSILDALTTEYFVDYVSVADKYNLIPWDVLFSLRRLVSIGAAIEGRDRLSGHFKKVNR